MIGSEMEPKCHQNLMRRIDRTTCKNNCKEWVVLGIKDNGKYKKGCRLKL